MHRRELTKLELYQEDGLYFLRAEYEVEDNYRLEKHTIPKIHLPIGSNVTIRHEPGWCGSITHPYEPERNTVDFGFGELNMCKDKNGQLYTMEVLKEYPKKMTLEEIEKKLGYKVEVVSGK